jgi:hypothetical protein
MTTNKHEVFMGELAVMIMEKVALPSGPEGLEFMQGFVKQAVQDSLDRMIPSPEDGHICNHCSGNGCSICDNIGWESLPF